MTRFLAPLISFAVISSFCAQSASAQTADIFSLIKARQLAHQQGTLPPPAVIPDTVPYSYVVTREIETKEGDEVISEVLRYKMNPMAAPGARLELLTGVMEDLPKDMRRELERYNNEMSLAEIADEFWCEDNEEENPFDEDFDASEITVISETDTLAHISIGQKLLAEFIDDGGDMPKKIRKNLSMEAMISKPDLKIMGMQLKLMKPVTVKIVAKIKEMEMRQSCEFAPNGLLFANRKTARVRGKALGTRFNENMNETISELQRVDGLEK